LKAIHRLNEIPIKFPMSFFMEIEKNNINILKEIQETLNS
jgi:hypothetical protein